MNDTPSCQFCLKCYYKVSYTQVCDLDMPNDCTCSRQLFCAFVIAFYWEVSGICPYSGYTIIIIVGVSVLRYESSMWW